MFSVSFIKHPSDFLRQSSPDVLSRKVYPVKMSKWWDFGCWNPLFILVINQTSSDRHIGNRGKVTTTSSLQWNIALLKLSEPCNLAVTYFIWTWREVYIPQEFPHLLGIIFLSYSTPSNYSYKNTSARREQHRTRRINERYTHYVTARHTARMQTPVSSRQWCECCYQNYDRGWTFKNGSYNWKQQ